MKNTTSFWVMLVIALLSGWDAIVRNFNNATEGVGNWWSGLAPIIQLGLVILAIYLLIKWSQRK